MARKTHTFVIEGWTYTMTQLGALTGRRLAVRLAKVLASAAPTIKRVMDNTDGAIDGIEDLAEFLNEEDLEVFWNEFASVTIAKAGNQTLALGEPAIFDEHFAGQFVPMMKFFGEGLKLNFAGFFEQLPADSPLMAAAQAAQKIASPSTSQSTSTGSSGESSPPVA
jgi:hypothetical protein